jgi:hypothetical protein
LERKPLDELLGFEKYQRQSPKAIQQVGATLSQVKKRVECLDYLRNNAAFIIRGPSMGAIESNVGKLIAQRMKTCGVSWSLAGAKGMPLLILNRQELYEKSFKLEALKTGKTSTPYANLFKAIIHDDLPLSV